MGDVFLRSVLLASTVFCVTGSAERALAAELKGHCVAVSKAREETFCVDVESGEFVHVSDRRVAHTPTVLAPNRPLRVIVQRSRETGRTAVELNGKAGLVAPTNAAEVRVLSGVTEFDKDVILPPPSEAGAVVIKDHASGTLKQAVQFIVQKEYAAAVRIGVGLAWLPGRRDETYVASQLPGSAQSEVVRDSTSPFAGELVFSFAPFVFDRWFCGRFRPEVVLEKPACHVLAPFIGFAAFSVNSKGITPFTSLYAGLDIALTPTFSIGVGYVVRRVEDLRGGLQIGTAVSSDTDLTTTRAAHGLGLVLNVGPEFLKLAGGGLK